jgi:hypothetical protein
MASQFPPIGRGPDAIVLPAGSWRWPPDARGLLLATDGRAIEYRSGATLDGPGGLFVHGGPGDYLLRPRLTDGSLPLDWPRSRAAMIVAQKVSRNGQ